MSSGRVLRELGRRAAACLAIALAAAPAMAGAASAETTFGGNPEPEMLPEVSSEISCAPLTCTLYWNGSGAGDLVPLGPGGGSGTVTGVTLPALLDPGPMQAVVLTSTTEATHDPSQPKVTCCTVKEVSAPFTVPPGQVTTVPLSLHVSATAAANLGKPGSTSTADGVGITITEAEASAPIHATENPADVTRIWAPALTAPSSTATAPLVEREGYELDARFTFVEAMTGGKPGSPGEPGSPGGSGSGADAGSGVVLHHGALRPGRDGRTLILGTAANPPTASTRQTLTAPVAKGSSAAGKAKKPVVLAHGTTTVADGKKTTMKLTLNRTGRAALAEAHRLKATLTIVARNPAGEARTLTRRVVVGPGANAGRANQKRSR